jgi:WD40 repeat protein/predicted Ser/Thr protein kinase
VHKPPGVCTLVVLNGMTPSQRTPDPVLPCRFGNHELLEEIGRGGTGVIYRARQLGLNRTCAVKMLHPASPAQASAQASSLFAEAQAAASLDHPNIVRIFEMGTAEGREFFSMEFIPGENLGEWARTRLVSTLDAARLVRDIAEAVAFAHGRGVWHLDLKPANILMDADGRPHLTDFGMARLARAVQERDPGLIAGTPNYLAPEQAGSGYGSPRAVTDVFGIGGILYFLLTDRAPFRGETLAETLRAVLEDAPAPPRSLRPGVPEDLEFICLKCLEKRPSRRYKTVQEVASDLRRFLNDEPIQGRTVAWPTRAAKWWRRHPLAGGLGLLAGSLLMVLAGSATNTALRMERERDRADHMRREAEARVHRAEQVAEAARRRVYEADMALAFGAWEAGAEVRVREILERHRPASGGVDFRGWEWRFLAGQVRSDETGVLGRMDGEVQRLAVSADGRRLWAADTAGVVAAWDLAGGLLVSSNRIREPGPASMVLSPDERWLAVGDRSPGATNSLVKIVDSGTGATNRLWAVPGMVGPRAISPDGHTVWMSGRESVVALTVETGEFREYRLGTNTVPVCLAVSPDGAWVVVGHGEPGLTWIDTSARWEPWVRRMDPRDGVGNPEVTSLVFSPDGRWLVSGSADGVVRWMDVTTRRVEAEWPGHGGAVVALRFHADPARLLSLGRDSSAMVREFPSGRELARIRGLQGTGLDAVWVGDAVVTASGDRTVRRWRASTEARHVGLTNLPSGTIGTALLEGGRHAMVTTSEGTRLWGLPGGAELLDFPVDPDALASAVHVGAGGIHAARYWLGGLVGVRRMDGDGVTDSVREGDWVAVPRFSKAADLAFSADGRRLAVADTANGVRVYRTEPVRLEHRFPVTLARGIRFSPDGRRLAAMAMSGRVLVWDLDPAVPTLVSNEVSQVESMAFSRDGNRLVVSGLDGTLRMLDARTGRGDGVLDDGDHGRGLISVAMSPDGGRVLAGTMEGWIGVWNVAAGGEVGWFRAGGAPVQGLEFREDGSLAVATGAGLFIYPAGGE